MTEKRVAPWMVAAGILAALVAAGLLVALSQLGGAGEVSGDGQAREMLSGIPQDGTTLGREDAPVEIRLYEDLQCPACAQFAEDSLPKVIERHVEPGEARLKSETLAFLGPDSVTAGKAALAAGEQDRYWDYATLFFANQGSEGSGYADEEFLRGVAEEIGGLDAGRWDERREAREIESELQRTQEDAADAGVESTPTIVISGPGGERELVGAVSADDVTEAIREVEGS